jgi:hypothetical protein
LQQKKKTGISKVYLENESIRELDVEIFRFVGVIVFMLRESAEVYLPKVG